ncbi:MAG: glycoside hydrolase family 3 C-terminal domain-containing protein [Lachnospiraceae bacterium]|nr:glycoside hydrolase family 3 C-terminal domain-containing protein [Lachnospiraceae bacterium]
MEREQLQALLADMSLEEKIGQMVQLNASFLGNNDTLITGPMGTVSVDADEVKLCGTILGTAGADKLKELQKQAMEGQPHHIPMLFMMDVINGFQTIFPIPLAQGCSFEPELAKQGAQIAAKEAAAAGLHVTFTPMLDLTRDARWGRVMESPGEDPYLNSCFAKAMVEGFQGSSLSEKGRISACLKHFAAYGYPEGGREYDNVELSERTFRQDYLTGYQGAVDANCRMAMTSFNSLNRVPSTANRWLMRDVLRGEMGFDGVLISDYAAVEELIPHGIAADKREAAKLALEAGVDIDMMSDVYLHYLKDAVEAKEVDEALIDEAVMRILTLKNDLGLFENPDKDASAEDEKALILCDAHRQAACEAAVKTFVLLKNEAQILPLAKEEADGLLVSGPYADSRLLCGSWSFPSTYDNIPTIRERMTEAVSGQKITFTEGCSLFYDGEIVKDHTMEGMNPEQMEAAIAETVEAAKKAKNVVLCLGEYYTQTGEGSSRTSLQISQNQMELLRRVSEVNENVITVIFSGRPLEMTEIEALSKAVLYVWMPGTEGAKAITDVLFGEKEPTGRLSMSFPHRAAQEPLYYSRFQGGRPRTPQEPRGFRIGYIDIEYRPYHSFGYGLSYSTFNYSPVSLDSSEMTANSRITAKVTLTNTGNRRATETVQMYLRDVSGSVIRPMRELKGFEKVTLDPGESRDISFVIEEPMLRFVRMDMSVGSEPGRFEVFIGADSTTENGTAFVLK